MSARLTIGSRPPSLIFRFSRADLWRIPLLAMLYLLIAIVAMKFGTVQGNATVVWPSSGLALFALLAYGRQLWPGILIGAFAAGLWIHDPAWVSLPIAVGNTLDALLAVWLLQRTTFDARLNSLTNYYQLIFQGALAASLPSTLIGPAALAVAGYFVPDQFFQVALHWWMGNSLGIVLIAPVLLIWRQRPDFLQRREQMWEAAMLWGLSIAAGLMVFSGWNPTWLPFKLIVMPFWLGPLVIWSALRFGHHGVSLQLILYFAQSLMGVATGNGLFAHDLVDTGLINFWFFHMIASIFLMTLGVALHERQRAAEQVLAEKTRLRSVIDAIPDLIFFKDSSGTYTGCNQAFTQFMNAPQAAILGKTDLDHLPQESAQRFQEQDRHVLTQNIAQVYEEWIDYTNGTRRMHETVKTPLHNAEGQVIGLVGISRDISARKAAEQERERLYNTISASLNEIYIFDADSLRFQFVNAGALDNLGYTLQEARQLTPLDLNPLLNADDFRQLLAPLFMHERPVEVFETCHKRQDGSVYPVEVHLQLFENGNERYFLAIIQNITPRMEAEQALRLAASVFEHSKQAIIITDADVRIVSVNQAFTNITGFSANEVLGHNPRLLSSGSHDKVFYQAMWASVIDHGSWSGEVWNRRKDGSLYVEWLDICSVRSATGQLINYIGLSHDITDRKAAEENMRHLAQHDFLTGLPNRVLFYDRFEQALASARRNQTRFAVFFLDLNRFKHINDTLGHQFGDDLLKAIAVRLTDTMRATDTICRLGGDEFVILVPEIDDVSQADSLTEKLHQKFRQSCEVNGREIVVSFSIGRATYPENGDSMNDLLQAADLAMYQSKNTAKMEKL